MNSYTEKLLDSWNRLRHLEINDCHLHIGVILARTLVLNKEFTVLRDFVNGLTPDQYALLHGSQQFVKSMIEMQRHEGNHWHVIRLIKNGTFKCKTGLLQLWDQSHYDLMELEKGRPLTRVDRFRVRKRFPPPPSICPRGQRPLTRHGPQSISQLRSWLEQHQGAPYPTAQERQVLAAATGLSDKQVRIWFKNARHGLQKTKLYSKYETYSQQNDITKSTDFQQTIERKSTIGLQKNEVTDSTINLHLNNVANQLLFHQDSSIMNLMTYEDFNSSPYGDKYDHDVSSAKQTSEKMAMDHSSLWTPSQMQAELNARLNCKGFLSSARYNQDGVTNKIKCKEMDTAEPACTAEVIPMSKCQAVPECSHSLLDCQYLSPSSKSSMVCHSKQKASGTGNDLASRYRFRLDHSSRTPVTHTLHYAPPNPEDPWDPLAASNSIPVLADLCRSLKQQDMPPPFSLSQMETDGLVSYFHFPNLW